MNKRAAGSGYEMQAVQYLEGQGFQILERNFRSSSAEIDIVAHGKPSWHDCGSYRHR